MDEDFHGFVLKCIRVDWHSISEDSKVEEIEPISCENQLQEEQPGAWKKMSSFHVFYCFLNKCSLFETMNKCQMRVQWCSCFIMLFMFMFLAPYEFHIWLGRHRRVGRSSRVLYRTKSFNSKRRANSSAQSGEFEDHSNLHSPIMDEYHSNIFIGVVVHIFRSLENMFEYHSNLHGFTRMWSEIGVVVCQ